MNETPNANRVHIAFFGRTNAGKSSVINAVTGQSLSIVSDVKGTTTDPVQKAMELLPLGAVVVIDTPGLDDEGELGSLRIEKTYQVMRKTDIAVVVIDGEKKKADKELVEMLEKRNIPYIIAWNKSDIHMPTELSENEIAVSAKDGTNINELKNLIASKIKKEEKRIVADLIEENDFVVLVVPIDASAPKGRLILPQQQTIRDILDSHANTVVCQPSGLKDVLEKLGGLVKLVITDSQAFKSVSPLVPEEIPLTSFSILFARLKGDLKQNVEGAMALDTLPDGAKVLISEGCTHHRQCEDIGTVKLPKWIESYTGKKINFEWTSGGEFKEDISGYDLIVHCGACMLNEREMKYRLNTARLENIPMTNYGIAIAKINGILDRSIAVFGKNL